VSLDPSFRSTLKDILLFNLEVAAEKEQTIRETREEIIGCLAYLDAFDHAFKRSRPSQQLATTPFSQHHTINATTIDSEGGHDISVIRPSTGHGFSRFIEEDS